MRIPDLPGLPSSMGDLESHEYTPGGHLDTSEKAHDRDASQSDTESDGDRGSGTFRPLIEYEDGYREVTHEDTVIHLG